jgi:hypothetical protein
MDKATEIWLKRLDRDCEGLDPRLSAINSKLGDLECDLAEVNGTIKPKELPWGFRFILISACRGSVSGARRSKNTLGAGITRHPK